MNDGAEGRMADGCGSSEDGVLAIAVEAAAAAINGSKSSSGSGECVNG